MHRSSHHLRSVVATLTVGSLLSACGGGGTPSPTALRPTGIPSVVAPSNAARTPYADADAVITVAAGPRGVALAGGGLWVASTIGNRLQRVDVDTARVTAEVDIGRRPVTVVSVGDDVWVSVLNGDPSSDDELVRVDPVSGEIVDRVVVPIFHNIAVGGGLLWVMDGLGTLHGVDPVSSAVISTSPAGGTTIAIAANDDAVWGIRADRTVWRIPIDGGERQEAQLGVAVPGRSRTAVNASRLFVAVPGMLLALNPTTLAIEASLPLLGMELVNDLYVTDRDLWLSAHVTDASLDLDGGSVLRLDPQALEITSTFRLGPESSGVVAADGRLWAVDQDDGRLARWTLP